MATVILPLWIVSLGASPLIAGIALGCRYVLLTFLSIHSGALMDRIGTRKVMLIFGIAAIIFNGSYPFFPELTAVVLIQLFAGWAGAMGCLGSQTLIGHLMKGNSVYAGRLSASLRVAAFVGPPLVGAIWDFFGAWSAFGFLAAWGALPVISAMFLPKDFQKQAVTLGSFSDLLPRWLDYSDAFRLLAVPAIVLLLAITIVRYAGISIQHTFYVVWLNEIGLTGIKIGFLLSIWAVAGGCSALFVGKLLNYCKDIWLAIAMVSLQILLLTITPLIPNYVSCLLVMAVYGATMGISQPLLIGMMARATPQEHQGKSAGLRATANQSSGFVLPITMGAIAEWIGLKNAFFVIGLGVLTIMLVIVFTLGRKKKYFISHK